MPKTKIEAISIKWESKDGVKYRHQATGEPQARVAIKVGEDWPANFVGTEDPALQWKKDDMVNVIIEKNHKGFWEWTPETAPLAKPAKAEPSQLDRIEKMVRDLYEIALNRAP
jgi:hypothetical protein